MGNYYWSPGLTIKSMQESFVADAIKFYNGSKQSAANSLGITLAELEAIVKRSQLDKEAQDKVDATRKKEAQNFLDRSRGIIGVDKDGHDTLSPYVPADGLDQQAAVQVLEVTALNQVAVTPESAIPSVAVLPNAGDAVSAAQKTKILMQQSNLQAEQTFPEEG
jgi:hypothetical protein